MRTFESLTEKEILALAITLEEEDSRVYADFAEGLKDSFPATAQIFEGMRKEEIIHRDRLFDAYRQRFGEHIPLLRREDVKGFVKRRPICLFVPSGLTFVPNKAATMGEKQRRFYEK